MEKLLNYKQKTFIIFTAFLFILSLSLNSPLNSNTQSQNIYIIPISGEIDPSMSAFITRSTKGIDSKEKPIIIFEIDTFGGRVDSALQIVETISNLPIKNTISYVKTKAISAGALISLSSSKLIMKNNTTIGDCAPISYSDKGPQMLGEKFQSPLRAKFRSLAKKNGYPETLAEAMVTAEMEVYRIRINGKTLYLDSTEYKDLSPKKKKMISSKKTIVSKGELLTMDDVEAFKLGFSKMSVSSIDEMLKKLKIKNYKLTEIKKNWTESLLGFILTITPLLMMIGLAAIYVELKAPGFGTPGIVGIICLALAFGSQYTIGLADYTEVLIILLGIALIALEIFVIPGFGIAGVSGIICVVVGMILSLQDFTLPDPSFPWQKELLLNNITIVFGSFLVSFISSLFVLRYIFPKLTAVTDGPYLGTTLKESRADSNESQKANVGDEGIAISYLRPSGKIKINNEIYDVITEGEFIEAGSHVKITKISGNKITVIHKDI